MNEACPRQPEGGKLTVTHGGGYLNNLSRKLYNGFLSYNGFTTDFLNFSVFGPHFGPEFKGVIEYLDTGRRGGGGGGGCFKNIKMRLGPRCSRL
jgi:hypothetical protein